jgi:hydroxyacylglutathione hydrolase
MTAEMASLVLGPLETNCYLVADVKQGAAAVIDPGDEPWNILHELAMREWHLEWILVTHAHFDHIAACGELMAACSCRIALHSADLPLWWMGGHAGLFGIEIPEMPAVQHSLKEGEPLTVGTLRMDVLHVPGHTPGHTAFYLKESGWLFSGDVLFAEGGRGRTDLPGGDEKALVDGIRSKLFTLPPATRVLPGHGAATDIGREIAAWAGMGRPSTPGI